MTYFFIHLPVQFELRVDITTNAYIIYEIDYAANKHTSNVHTRRYCNRMMQTHLPH